MSDDLFLDTNILIYATEDTDPKAGVARMAVAQSGISSVQVLNEFADVAERKMKWDWPDIVLALQAFRGLCRSVSPLGLQTHEAALTIATREQISFWDGLIVASALEARRGTLLTEDMQHGRVIGGRLTIRNPFVDIA